MRSCCIVLCAVVALQACRLSGEGDSGRFELVDVPDAVAPPRDGTILLVSDSRIEWTRVYATPGGPATHRATGRYLFHGDTLRVTWSGDAWYTLGTRRGDTLRVWYSGVVDEPHLEFYVRR